MTPTGPQQEQMLTFLTAEHSALQATRSSITLDINGRTALYLGAVSSGVVALAFIGQVAGLERAFANFAFVLLPALLLMGLITFLRVLQAAIEDTLLLRAINRIRHFYLDLVPEAARYLSLSTHDDVVGASWDLGVRMTGWQLFLYSSGMIAMINSVLLGVLLGLVASRFGAADLFSGAAGVVAFVLSAAGHALYQNWRWRAAQRERPPAFPTGNR